MNKTYKNTRNGFSLVELLVAMTLGLVLLGGIYKVFISSTRTYQINQAVSRLQENGRFAISFLTPEIRQAGYSGCLQDATKFVNTLNNPSSYTLDFKTGIQGFDAQGTGWSPVVDATITNPLAGSDIITLRGLSAEDGVYLEKLMNDSTADLKVTDGTTNIADDDILLVTDCEAAAVFQVTNYTASNGNVVHNVGTGVPGNSTTDLGHAFKPGAEIARIRTSSFFISTNPSGQPALYRTDYPNIPGMPATFELVEGIENMQIRYGVAANSNKSSPITGYVTAAGVTDWDRVKSVRIALLVRTLNEINGLDADVGNYSVNGVTVVAPGDRRLRHVFTTTISVRNRLQ